MNKEVLIDSEEHKYTKQLAERAVNFYKTDFLNFR